MAVSPCHGVTASDGGETAFSWTTPNYTLLKISNQIFPETDIMGDVGGCGSQRQTTAPARSALEHLPVRSPSPLSRFALPVHHHSPPTLPASTLPRSDPLRRFHAPRLHWRESCSGVEAVSVHGFGSNRAASSLSRDGRL